MPRQRLPVQYFADILDELKGVNERLDTLIGQSAPQPAPAEPTTAEPERVRLEEPVRPAIGPSSTADLRDAAVDLGIDVENDADVSPIGQHGICQAVTKRGNVCGRSLPCSISSHG